MKGPFTHVVGPLLEGGQLCRRCGIVLTKAGRLHPQGALVTAVGDGTWRPVARATHQRPMCPLAFEIREALASVP